MCVFLLSHFFNNTPIYPQIAGIGMITAGGIAHTKIADYNDFLRKYLRYAPKQSAK